MELKIIKNTEKITLIEVEYENDMDKVSQVGFTGEEKYIKLTKGKQNSILIYDEDHKVISSFEFGGSRTTLISSDLEKVKLSILKFVLSHGINYNLETEETYDELTIFPPQKGFGVSDKYNVHLGDHFAMFLPDEDNIKKVFGNYRITKENVSPNTGARSYSAEIVKRPNQLALQNN